MAILAFETEVAEGSKLVHVHPGAEELNKVYRIGLAILATPCPYRKSIPNVLVMESAKEWNGLDARDRLHRPADGRILLT
jgi:hypothetical protein